VIVMDGAGRIHDWNPAAARIFGRSREEAVGKVVAELIATSPRCSSGRPA
jgi:PAS domain S-box-containing protein